MFFSKAILLVSIALSANALYTPLAGRSPHQHRALAARVAAVEHTPAVATPVVRVTPRKRAVKRCKASSAAVPSATEAPASSSSSSAESTPTPSQAPANAGNAPPVFSSSSVSPSVSPSPSPAEQSQSQSHSSSSPFISLSSSLIIPVNPEQTPDVKSSSSPSRSSTHATPSSTPSPSSSVAPAPSTSPRASSSPIASSSSEAPATPTTKKTSATPTPTQASSTGGDGTTYSGDGTFYDTGLGACGLVNADTDYIAAVAHGFFDSYGGGYSNPNNAPICNKKVRATYQGKSVDVTITDRCGGCDGEALDFSPSAFNQIADPSVGRIHGMTWQFI